MRIIFFQRINFFVLLVLFFFMGSHNTVFGATTIRVPTTEYPTIQAGIDAASDGDTILVADGTYTGEGNKDIDINGKAITVQSENGPSKCIIDCEGNGRGFYLQSDAKSTINGFTITNGVANYGGAIRCVKSNTIINCRIIDNQANASGGGVFFVLGNLYQPARIINCIFAGNTAAWGGAMYFSSSNAQVINCTTIKNTGTGSIGNSCSSYPPSFTNCILWEDTFYLDPYCLPSFSYCDIKGTSITGSTIINSDPLFVDVMDPDPMQWDLHLSSSSPCIDKGTSAGAPDTDIDGNSRPQGPGYDMGAYEHVKESSSLAGPILLLLMDE